MCLLACLSAPHLEHPVNIEKSLKMIVAHDLVEAIAGDIPFFEESERQQNKYEAEVAAMAQLVKILPEPAATEIQDLWLEFEGLSSIESRFVKALDNLDVQMQHNLADIKTWEPIEYQLVYSKMRPRCMHDKFLEDLCTLVEIEGEQKMIEAGIDINAIRTKVADKAG
jgi:putative hydrolases of HD superfamily